VKFDAEIPFSFLFRGRTTELPETENESCEYIDPPGERCLRKFSLGDVQVVFAPVAVSSFEGAPWPLLLGCWTAEVAATLETVKRILQRLVGGNGTEA
jgi:hypothetical protein